jgi:hypothetical protein
MKRLITVLLACLLAGAVHSQDFLANCTVDRFSYVQFYAQPSGGGFEAGLWPQDVMIGAAIGVSMTSKSVYASKAGQAELVKTTEVGHLMYVTGITRVNRFVYGTGRVGISDLNDLYYGMGIRLSVPINTTRLPCSMLLEPQYTTLGFNATAGFGLAF